MDLRRGLRLCQTMNSSSSPSPALVEANRRLYELRASGQHSLSTVQGSEADSLNTDDGSLITDSLPAHLGWGSEALTAVLRATARRREKTTESYREGRDSRSNKDCESIPNLNAQESPTTAESAVSAQVSEDTAVFVRLYPDLALGMLAQGQAAAGRIWLLLRLLDRVGCGNIRIATIQQHLTCPTSSHYLCGERQLRKLLKAGEGIFWQRDGEQLWLRSVGKVAVALGVERLNSRPIALPLTALLGGVGEVKAHFYASFHSGRKSHNPISRETLEKVTHVPSRTQRAYEKMAGISAKRNMAVGERYSAETVQQRAWFHGRAVFDFIDHHGRQGPEKRHYVAWHLPNSYTGCHAVCSKGRQKKVNREIGLVKQQARGNDFRRHRLFYPDGATAAKAYNRDSTKDRYWHQDGGRRLEAGQRLAGGHQPGSGRGMGNGQSGPAKGGYPANGLDISADDPDSASGRDILANGRSMENGRDITANSQDAGNGRNALTNDQGVGNGRHGQPDACWQLVNNGCSVNGRNIITNGWDRATSRGLANGRSQTLTLWWVLGAAEGN